MTIKFNFNKRLNRLRKSFAKNKIDSYFINNKKRIYYLTGYLADEAFVLVTRKNLFLFTDARFADEIKSKKYNFKPIISSDKISKVKDYINKLNLKNVGFEADYLNYSFFKNLTSSAKPVSFRPSQSILDDLMAIKDENEIKAIKKAIKVVKKSLAYFNRIKKINKTERDIALSIQDFILRQGTEMADFDIILLSDKKTAFPHGRPSDKKIKKGSNVLIDLGAKAYGYNSDLTRTYSLSTMKMSKRFKKIFKIVKTAQDIAIKVIKPGIKVSTIDESIRKFFKRHNLEKYMRHAAGHGVGLSVHEKPTISYNNNEFLKPGMVLAVEPGIYIPGKFGVRIEDMVLVTKNKYKVLSNDIPKTV